MKWLFLLLEVKILEREVNFNYSSGFHSSSQDVLFCGLVVFGSKSVKIIQETKFLTTI